MSKRLRLSYIFLLSFISTFITICKPTYADFFQGGGPGAPSGGLCAEDMSSPPTHYGDTCVGVTWRKYTIGSTYTFFGYDRISNYEEYQISFNTSSSTQIYGKEPAVKGGEIETYKCPIGTTEIYILGFEVFNPQKSPSNPEYWYNYHYGIMNIGYFNTHNVAYANITDSNVVPFSKVEDLLEIAYENGQELKNDTYYFCYNDEWEETIEVKSEVQGHKKTPTESSWSDWGATYTDEVENGDPAISDSWDFHFRHYINGEEYNGSNCPSGYTCSVSTTDHSQSLTTADTKTGEEILTVTKNGTTKTSSASYTVSKSTQEIIDESKKVTYDTECSTSSANPYTINATETTADVTFVSSAGSLLTSISTWPQSIKDYINNNLPEPSDYDSVTETRSLNPGEFQTVSHTFKQKKYTIYYKKTVTTQPNGSTTVEYSNFSHTVSDGNNASVCPDIIIYREAEASIQIKNKMNLSGTYNSDSYSVTAGYTNDTNREITKTIDPIYAGSDQNNSIKISTTHWIKRTDTINSSYPAYTVNFPWNALGDIKTESDNTTLQPNDEKKANINPYEITITNNPDLPLGTYDYEINDEFTSYSKFTIDHHNDASGVEGTETSVKTTAHIYRPWNYNLSFTKINSESNNGMVYSNNNQTKVKVQLKNASNSDNDNNQPGNPSYSPETTITLHQLTIPDANLEGKSIEEIKAYLSDLENQIQNGGLLPSSITAGSIQDCDINNTGITVPCKITINPESSSEELTFTATTSTTIGNHVCFYATANHTNSKADTNGNPNKYYGTPNPNNRYSPLSCFTIASLPTFQVRGGSIFTDGDIKAKVVTSNGETFGSWIDYGIVTNGSTQRIYSGKALASSYEYPKNHPLTIANDIPEGGQDEPRGKSNINMSSTKDKLIELYTPNNIRKENISLDDTLSWYTADSTKLDTYKQAIDISNSQNFKYFTSNSFITKSDSPTKYKYTYINLGNQSPTVIYQGPGSVLGVGETHVIYAEGNGTLIIGSNFEYASAEYKKITDIPQFIIISDGNVYIDENVSEIHAWIIAKKEVNTCVGYENWESPESPYNKLHQAGNGYDSTAYYSGICDTKLNIYGPVFANKIWLERTHTNGAVSDVSEIINLTAENYYWALAKAKEGGKVSTVYNRSLAPRL